MSKSERLEHNLVLNNFLLNKFGFLVNYQLFKVLSDKKEGYDENGKSYFFNVLKSLPNLEISIDLLEKYDYNIKNYLKQINYKRDIPIQLKYFQYLTILFTEFYLDQLFNNIKDFNENLNGILRNEGKYDLLYSEDHLMKVAYWMATGSGKTLIMHINYLQFLNYNIGKNKINYDNIILITPNENLSKQHLDEFKKSSIDSEIFSNSNQGYFVTFLNPKKVKIIDIHKISEEKKGQGVSIDKEYFGSKNILFVDEGHKGSGGDVWKNLREYISQEGFTFEYSATFGQAINRPGKQQKELFTEYSKAIIFDYSYHYFHNDGYGKDYRILNLKENVYKKSKNTLMLANLLAFFEQKLIYKEIKDEIRDYNIEEPLWIFVGSKVTGKNQQSDIFEIITFINNFMKNNDNWVIETISNILKGKSDILDKKNRDIFSPRYPEKKLEFLRKHISNPKTIYDKIIQDIFHSKKPSKLCLVDLKKTGGEVALKLVNSDYFGVITIGDKSSFLKLVKSKGKKDFIFQEDVFSRSIFDDINRKDSNINILIGAKKFIEGWDSWRVSNMGLLNIGKREGTQIIQLFGRGVRLKGKKMSLKRSNYVEAKHPDYLTALETLNIFGIKANYMDQFREFLESEGINTDNFLEYSIPIKIEDKFLKKNLQIPIVDEEKFQSEYFFELKFDNSINVRVDLIPRGEIIESQKDLGIQATTVKGAYPIPNEYLDLLDWDEIFFDLYNYRSDREWWNIIFTKEILHRIISMAQYSLYCIPKMLQIKKFEEINSIEEIVKIILRKYLYSFYNRTKNEWMKNNMSLVTLNKDHSNFKNYKITVNEKRPFIVSEIQNLVENYFNDFLIGEKNGEYLRNAYFNEHLYQPLLVDSENFMITPKGILEKGEEDFIKNLRYFIDKKPDILKNKEIYLLRNLPKIGIGFFENYYFYPDFILWILEGDKQNIIFVDPKGLVFIQEGLENRKLRLNKDIKNIEETLVGETGKQITLDSFIISVSAYQTVKSNFTSDRGTLEKNNILFQEDPKHIEKLFVSVIE